MIQILSDDVMEALRGDAEVSPELERLSIKVRNAAELLKALAHENRLLILCLLCERERSVTELEQLLALSQPTVSQQIDPAVSGTSWKLGRGTALTQPTWNAL